jgi:hypothetical protein
MVCALMGIQWWYHGIEKILSVFYQTPQKPIFLLLDDKKNLENCVHFH